MHKRDETQRGVVSFIVTLIMMFVITLIVIGFTQVVNRTQREALDRQLSAQAQYAAESGINMVKTKLTAASTTTKTDCDPTSGPYGVSDASLSSNVSITCVLVDPNSDKVIVHVSQSQSTIIPISVGDPLGSLTFTWSSADAVDTPEISGCGATGNFPTNTNDNCTFALLRADIVQMPSTLNATNLANNTSTFYMQPVTSASASPTFTTTAKYRVVGASCNESTNECKVTINFSGSSNYYLRLSTLYRDAPKVTITGVSTVGAVLHFRGTQAVIDVTGKAQDVLKRVQVRYPIGITYGDTPYAIQSESTICKRYTVGNGVFSNGCQ